MTNKTFQQGVDQMVQVPVSELSAQMIDWLTARSEGVPVEFDGTYIRHCPVPNECEGIYSPSTNAIDGHPLLEREKIQLRYVDSPGHASHGLWLAQDCRFRATSHSVEWSAYGIPYPELALGYLTGPTMLIAGLRFIIAKTQVGKSKAPMVRVPLELVSAAGGMMKKTSMRPMSPLMLQVLKDIAAGKGAFHGCSGRSEHGGRNGTIVALAKRGFITGSYELTDAGRVQIATL